MVWLWLSVAWPCGGFFCAGGVNPITVPVEQSAERILFVVNDDDTITTYVEVAYERNEDVDFAWVIPIPEPIEPRDIETTDAELFNELETATAPQFFFFDPTTDALRGAAETQSAGCGSRSVDQAPPPVEVVAEAVVGPFAIEVITANDAPAFAAWLSANDYDLPNGAVEPLQHYVDLNMAYLGVKLAPNAPEGPIDTLAFTYPGTSPMIPLILTAIASVDDLPITAYVLADQPFAPANWVIGDDVAPRAQPVSDGTDYLDRVARELDRHDGRAFILEYAQRTEDVPSLSRNRFNRILRRGEWLTRWRGDISPSQMTLDPQFAPAPRLGEYSNQHFIRLPTTTPSDTGLAWLIPVPLVLLAWLRRRTQSH